MSSIILECRYIGAYEWLDRDWVRWKAYRDKKTAEMAMDNLKRKHKYLEFRIKPDE